MVFHAGKYTIVPRIPIQYAFPCFSCQSFPSWKSHLSPSPTRLAVWISQSIRFLWGTNPDGIWMLRPYFRKTSARSPVGEELGWTMGSGRPETTETKPLKPNLMGGSQTFWVRPEGQGWLGFFVGCFFCGWPFFLPVQKGFGLEVPLNPVSAWKRYWFIFSSTLGLPHPGTVTNEGL